MESPRVRYATLGVLSIYWLFVIYSILHTISINHNIYPRPELHQIKIAELLISSLFLLFFVIYHTFNEFKKEQNSKYEVRKLIPLLLFVVISVPVVFSYVYDNEVQTVGQIILDIGTALMDEDFDDLPPGVDPPGWGEIDGTWSTVDDGGNIVYYQDDNADKEALTISTTGNSSWTDYTYEVDVKFVEGNTKKDDRGALLLFRYQGGNSYYFLWMKEGLDTLELHSHGDGAHMVTSTPCTLVPDTWYHVNVTIMDQYVWVTIDDTIFFSSENMNGAFATGNVAIGTSYYKVMFDKILVEPK